MTDKREGKQGNQPVQRSPEEYEVEEAPQLFRVMDNLAIQDPAEGLQENAV